MMPSFPSKKSFISFWSSFYPQKYKNLIYKYSKKFNVEPAFSWGILREESAYNPFALSSSKAYGLMQLLYPTALETAQRIGMTLDNPENLFKPEFNIPLGTKYLSVLLGMFKGDKFYTAASYNGGATNVKKWIKAYSHHEDIYDWSEEIPFEETNRYIYKVLSSYHTYRLLYEKKYFKIGGIDILNVVFKD
jgi:soluble lytic murein transglycosylase